MTTERNQPRMPVVEIETWQSDDGVIYADLVAGEGLTKAVLGVRAPHESGLELIIGGSPINTYINQVLTLDDVRALRDNLSALLNDACLLPPIPTMPAETDKGEWKAPLGTINGCAVEGLYCGRELMCASMTWQGLPISVYDGYLSIQVGEGLSFHGDMYFSEWRALAALGRTDIVDRLQALFKHCQVAQEPAG